MPKTEKLTETIVFDKPWPNDMYPPGGRPLQLSDLGNSERLAIAHGEDLHYCQMTKQWFCWDKRRFAVDSTGEVKRRAKRTVRNMLFEAAVMDNEKHRKELIAHQIRSESDRGIRAMMALAESDEKIAVRLSDFDRDPLTFNVLNGTIDLRTQELRPHSRENLVTKLAPVHYDPKATCPEWEKFLSEVLPGPGLVGFVQRAVGYSLTADATEEVSLCGRSHLGRSSGSLFACCIGRFLSSRHRAIGGSIRFTAPLACCKSVRAGGAGVL